jgi:drug/metabolite transporter (DMT)-like permease
MNDPAVPSTSDVTRAGKPRPGWFFNPYLQITFCIVLTSAAQLFLKIGAVKSVPEIWLGVEGLLSPWTWMAIAAMVLGLFPWLYSLRFVPLNVAYNLAGLSQVLVPIACSILLGEHIGLKRALGILLVCIGTLIVARAIPEVEEKL